MRNEPSLHFAGSVFSPTETSSGGGSSSSCSRDGSVLRASFVVGCVMVGGCSRLRRAS